jgi:hypothetical protein
MRAGALALGAADLLGLGVRVKWDAESAAFRFGARFVLNPKTLLLTACRAFLS